MASEVHGGGEVWLGRGGVELAQRRIRRNPTPVEVQLASFTGEDDITRRLQDDYGR